MNRIKIQVILLILQLETDYFSKLFISEMHSKQWSYSLHRDFQNCYSTRRSPTGFFSSNSSSNSTRVPIHPHTTYMCTSRLHPENSPSRIQFYMQKTKPCVLQDIPGTPAARPSKGIPDIPVFPVFPKIPDIPDLPETFQTFQSFMTFQPFQAILQVQYLQGFQPIPAFSN